jgi:UDP-glucose 4-epimerase
MGQERGRSLRVAITGPTSDFGALLLPRLLAEPRVSEILTFGPRPVSGARLVHRAIDLTRWDAPSELEAALGGEPVDVLFHLAFLHGRMRSQAFAHELEVIGTLHTLAAAARVGVRHVIVPSLTLVYGARPGNPVLLREDAELHGCPGSRFVSDRLEVERQLTTFRREHPEIALTVLRFAPILGPTVDNPATRYFRRPLVPTLLGFDPLWQAVHEEDARAVLLHLLAAPVDGTFNVVSDDVLPLSTFIRLAGTRSLPLPPPLARASLRALNAAGVTATPVALLDYLHYGWVADGARARAVLGFRPRYSGREAAASVRS